MRSIYCRSAIFVLVCTWFFVLPAVGESPPEKRFSVDLADVLPKSKFDSDIKTPDEFFGFALGSRHLRHHQLVDYARYLADASDRVRLLPYGETHGKRPLLMLMVTRDADQQDLASIHAERKQLTSGADLSKLPADAKTVAYYGYNVHGDEASAANAFPAVAYYVAAGKNAALSKTLDRSVLLLDPALNPDGVDRFANWANENRGTYANPNAVDREHNQPWPGGRSNYYWFDLNRDWLPTVHPESRGRIALFHQWKPNLVLDFHEMGGTSSYFFQPGIPARNNPLTPSKVFELTRAFGAEHAKTLDAADQLYFSEERFDDFYMGKGSTYPDLHGAIGILFEQGSTRGLHAKNSSYDRTFAETVANQIRTSFSSLRMLDTLNDELLQHQRDFYTEALALAAKSPVRAYVMHANGDQSRVTEVAALLRRHDIQVWIPKTEINVDGNKFAVGSVAIVPTDQPEFRFIESLMQRTQTFQENIFYDVSAWTVPLAFDLEVIQHKGDLPESWSRESQKRSIDAAQEKPNESDLALKNESIVGFSIDPVSFDVPRLIGMLLREDIQIRVAYEPFTAIGPAGQPIDVTRGSWLAMKSPNVAKWDRVVELVSGEVSKKQLIVHALSTGLTPVGPDLGSNDHRVIPKPELLLVAGAGTSSLDAGSLWHTLDQRWEMPVTLVDADDLKGIDLASYTCVILPSGSYPTWNTSMVEKMRRYASSGGTIVAIGSAIGWLKSKEMIAQSKPNAAEPDSKVETEPAETEPTEVRTFGGAANRAALERIAGAIFSSQADVTHPLAFGFPDASVPVFRTSTTAHQLPSNPLSVAARYDGVLAGYVSEKNRKQLMGTSAVWAENKGSGRIICIADSPTFRGYFRSPERFFSNALLLGPVLKIPSDGM